MVLHVPIVCMLRFHHLIPRLTHQTLCLSEIRMAAGIDILRGPILRIHNPHAEKRQNKKSSKRCRRFHDFSSLKFVRQICEVRAGIGRNYTSAPLGVQWWAPMDCFTPNIRPAACHPPSTRQHGKVCKNEQYWGSASALNIALMPGVRYVWRRTVPGRAPHSQAYRGKSKTQPALWRRTTVSAPGVTE